MNLRQSRRLKKMSQERLAELSGLTQIAISNIETGKASPNASTRRALEKALGGIHIDWLSGKGVRRFHNQPWEALEGRLRKLLYDVNFLSHVEQAQFLKVARKYLRDIKKGLQINLKKKEVKV